MGHPPLKPLIKKSKKGFSGYPIATVAFYGPNDKKASKAVIAIIESENAEPSDIKKWFSEKSEDVRINLKLCAEMVRFVKAHEPKSVVLTDKIIGCPHEEGTDYTEGSDCAQCEFWIGRDRWTGNVEH